MRTLLFCTSYAGTLEVWDSRWGMWLKAVLNSGIQFHQLLIVDDGSPVLPNWPGMDTITLGTHAATNGRVCLHHFEDRRGRDVAGQPFPGWYRSFSHAVMYGIKSGFDRIIHIEADAFLISKRSVDFFNNSDRGWVALWCRTHHWPESTLQVINKDSFGRCEDFFSKPYSAHLGTPHQPIEKLLPITSVNKDLIGDRYGELGDEVPFGADYVSQAKWQQPPGYYWWINDRHQAMQQDRVAQAPCAATVKYAIGEHRLAHHGIDYFEFLKFLDRQFCPEGYLEIGTESGRSVSGLSCDAICIDPKFRINQDVIGNRRKTLFFQTESDDFFRDQDPKLLLKTIDLGFLDGLHHFEALLRDFINFERHSHPGSIALLHDCLPLNVRMTSRDHQSGPEEEDPDTRPFWTGDVWRILPILKEYRPDLEVLFIDCPPTGLVFCAGLDSRSEVLPDAYQHIVQHYAELHLQEYGLDTLWRCFPILSSRRILGDPRDFCDRFQFRRESETSRD